MWDGGPRDTEEGVLGCCSFQNCCFREPNSNRVSLGFTAAKPMETCVHGFGAFGDNGLVGDSYFCVIFRLDKRTGFGKTNFDEGLV